MLGIPTPRRGDWTFTFLGFPVRVSLWFWLTCVLLGPRESLQSVILWIASVFVSILIHETGHGLVARRFGARPQLLLYELGGLCVYDPRYETSNQRIAVLFAGPGAQLLLLAVLMLFGRLVLGIHLGANLIFASTFLGISPTWIPSVLSVQDAGSAVSVMQNVQAGSVAFELYFYLFYINWFWALLNLLPIYPLDGGQITCELLAKFKGRDGRRVGHIISLLTAGALVAWTLTHVDEDSSNTLFRVLFFGMFAFVNFQILQSYQQRGSYYGDDADSWRRE